MIVLCDLPIYPKLCFCGRVAYVLVDDTLS